jgi:uncharacterized protein YndB with AHSA1/START domain
MPAKKKHDWSQVTLKIEIKASPDKVYQAWTDARLITRWFCVKAACDPRKNSRWSMHKGCETGWAFFLTNLKAYPERGIDLRARDPKESYARGSVNCRSPFNEGNNIA